MTQYRWTLKILLLLALPACVRHVIIDENGRELYAGRIGMRSTAEAERQGDAYGEKHTAYRPLAGPDFCFSTYTLVGSTSS